jgi:hypothetical protein
MWGALHLRAAISCARSGNAAASDERLALARTAGERVNAYVGSEIHDRHSVTFSLGDRTRPPLPARAEPQQWGGCYSLEGQPVACGRRASASASCWTVTEPDSGRPASAQACCATAVSPSAAARTFCFAEFSGIGSVSTP